MRGTLNVLARVLYGAIAFFFIAGIFIPFFPGLGWVGLEWMRLEIMALYVGGGVWAFWPYRSADSPIRKLLFLSIMAVAILVLVTDALAWVRPRLAAVLHHPIGTALGYLFGALLIVGLLVEARGRTEVALRK